MNPNESWFTRWVATPYQVMLRTLGQAPDLAAGEPSAELLDRAERCAPEGATPGSATAGATAPSVALLIDGENCAPSVAAHVLAKAGEFGTVRVRRVYANWAAASTRGWLEPVARYAIQPIHHEPTMTGKNATDILLTIDAMDLLQGGAIDCFCIVASDSDYTPLVARLRTAQRTVVVIGRAQTLPSLVQVSSVFLTLEELTGSPELPSPPPRVVPHTSVAASPSAAPAPKPAKALAPAPKPAKALAPAPKPAKAPAPAPKPVKAPAGIADVGPLLIAVWEGVRKARGAVLLSNFVNELQRLHPELQPQTYGHTRLAQLIKQRDDLFTIQQDVGNPSHQIVLRTARVLTAPDRSAVRALLKSAWQQAPKQDGWLPMTALGQQLKKLDPAFTPKRHGYARLGLLLQAHPDLFELRQRSAGQYDVESAVVDPPAHTLAGRRERGEGPHGVEQVAVVDQGQVEPVLFKERAVQRRQAQVGRHRFVAQSGEQGLQGYARSQCRSVVQPRKRRALGTSPADGAPAIVSPAAARASSASAGRKRS